MSVSGHVPTSGAHLRPSALNRETRVGDGAPKRMSDQRVVTRVIFESRIGSSRPTHCAPSSNPAGSANRIRAIRNPSILRIRFRLELMHDDESPGTPSSVAQRVNFGLKSSVRARVDVAALETKAHPPSPRMLACAWDVIR
jgi:hypothetical protein